MPTSLPVSTDLNLCHPQMYKWYRVGGHVSGMLQGLLARATLGKHMLSLAGAVQQVRWLLVPSCSHAAGAFRRCCCSRACCCCLEACAAAGRSAAAAKWADHSIPARSMPPKVLIRSNS